MNEIFGVQFNEKEDTDTVENAILWWTDFHVLFEKFYIYFDENVSKDLLLTAVRR